MKDLKYEHQSIFPLWGRVKINLGTGTENQIFILITPAAIDFFHQILRIVTLVLKKSFLTHMDLYDPYMVPYTIP